MGGGLGDVCRPPLIGDFLGGLGEICLMGDLWPLPLLRDGRVSESRGLPSLPPLSWAGLDEEDWSESE